LSDKRVYRETLESCSSFAEDRQPERVESEGVFDADRSRHTFQMTNLNLAGSSGEINGTYAANGPAVSSLTRQFESKRNPSEQPATTASKTIRVHSTYDE
jgi:hypothetical protein